MVTYNRPDPTQPAWSESGEAVRPTNTDIALGWPPTQIPPSRQEFNWLDSQQDRAIKYLCRVGIARWDPNEEYQGFGMAIGSNGSVYWSVQPSVGVDPVFDNGTAWELTMIRMSDADARYVQLAGGMFLTQAQGDARYQLLANMSNFLTIAQGDARYMRDLGQWVSFGAGDVRYALRSDLSLYESAAHAAATYLRIVDAANLYLTQSAAAQTYLSIIDANNRFAQAATDAQNDATAKMNNAVATVMAKLPGLGFEDVTRGNASGRWMTLGFTQGGQYAGSYSQIGIGTGICQQGDTIPVPTGWTSGFNFYFQGWVQSVVEWLPSLNAIGGFGFSVDPHSGYVSSCYFIKQNDGNQRRPALGGWVGFGWR